METTIFYYHFQKDLAEITGYNHLEKIDSKNLFKVAAHIYSKGLNVMIVHTTDLIQMLND